MSLMSSAHGRPWKCGHTMRNRLDLYIFLSPPNGKCVVKGTFYYLFFIGKMIFFIIYNIKYFFFILHYYSYAKKLQRKIFNSMCTSCLIEFLSELLFLF
jgi:hypothetical protein